MEYRFNTKWHYKAGAVIGEAYCFSRGEMLMHQEESFDIVSCRGLGEAQGELFNTAFHETQRSASSAFIGVSSFNMQIWFLRDKSSTI